MKCIVYMMGLTTVNQCSVVVRGGGVTPDTASARPISNTVSTSSDLPISNTVSKSSHSEFRSCEKVEVAVLGLIIQS